MPGSFTEEEELDIKTPCTSVYSAVKFFIMWLKMPPKWAFLPQNLKKRQLEFIKTKLEFI